VLPLQNLSNDPNQEYFSEGMTDALITDLAQIGSLKVISRTSTMRYKKGDKTLSEIARELNVGGIVEGTVQRFGNRVRITAQLISTPEDKNVWAETYDRDLGDVLRLQATVAHAIADEIKVNLTPQEEGQLTKAKVVNPKALDSYLSGLYHLQHMDDRSDARAKAIQYFQEAIKYDPSFAPPYVGIADALVHSSVIASSSDLDQAKSALAKALELDQSLINVHVSLASIRMVYDWDWAGAQKEYQRVLELDPNSAVGHDHYGYFLDAMGRLDEAMIEHQKAQALDPANDHLGGELYFRRQWNLERDLTVKLGGPNAAGNEDLYRAVEYERLGMEKQAIAEWARLARKNKLDDLVKVLEHGYATSGYKGAQKDLVRAMERIARKDYFAHWVIAHFCGELNDRDRAFAWLEKSYELRDDHLVFLKVDPFWNDNLRSDPRFADLIRRMGLPQ
jgi:TolB-like protein